MKIKKGDIVKVITGKDRSKEGKVLVAMPKENKIIVKGINIVTKHKKETRDEKNPGGRIKVEAPINASNVMLVDPTTGKPTRIGYKVDAKTGKKTRFSKKAQKSI
jgi:large subunit ribosomal protein L24